MSLNGVSGMGRWYCMAVLLLLSACADNSERSEVSPSPDMHSVEPVAPIANLIDVRFAYVMNGRIACELSESYESIFAEIENLSGYNVLAHEPWRADLTLDEEHYALSRIAERVGDAYTLLVPESNAVLKARLSTVTLLFTGLGTFGGIMGILDVEPGASLPPDDTTLLALPTAIADGLQVESPPAVDRVGGRYAGAVAFLQGAVGRELSVEQLEYLSTGPTPDTLAVVVKYADDQKDLYVLTSEGGNWGFVRPNPSQTRNTSTVAFPNQAENGIVFEHGHPETHVAMFGSRLFVLPDLNRDGLHEIFVDSSYDILFSVQSDGSRKDPASSLDLVEVRGIGFA